MSFLMVWKLHKEGNDPRVILVPTPYSSEFGDLSTETSNCEKSMDLIQRTFPTEAAVFVTVLQSSEPIVHMCNVKLAWVTIEIEKSHSIASANGRPKETKAKFSPNPEALGPEQIRKPPSKTRKREMRSLSSRSGAESKRGLLSPCCAGPGQPEGCPPTQGHTLL